MFILRHTAGGNLTKTANTRKFAKYRTFVCFIINNNYVARCCIIVLTCTIMFLLSKFETKLSRNWAKSVLITKTMVRSLVGSLLIMTITCSAPRHRSPFEGVCPHSQPLLSAAGYTHGPTWGLPSPRPTNKTSPGFSGFSSESSDAAIVLAWTV